MSKTVLILVNAPAYGSERALSALRIATTLVQHDDKPKVRLFLMSDSVVMALSGQQTGEKQTLELMLNDVVSFGGEVLLCKTCVNARGLDKANWIKGVNIGTIHDLAQWTLEADSTLCF